MPAQVSALTPVIMGLKDLLPAELYAVKGSNAPAAAPGGSQQNARPKLYSASEAKAEKPPIKMHSAEFYRVSAIGGWLSCGLTHAAVTPLDVVKCSMQVDAVKYPSIGKGFSVVWKEGGFAGITRGWFPTLIGYGFQGTCKFGFYEYFKKCVLS